MLLLQPITLQVWGSLHNWQTLTDELAVDAKVSEASEPWESSIANGVMVGLFGLD